MLKKVQEVLRKFENKYEARISGYTSIDVMDREYGKKAMVKLIIEKHGLKKEDVIFVGNETEDGAEADIKETGIRTLQVDDIFECNIFLKTIRQ